MAEFTIQNALDLARRYQNAGQLLEAERVYREILAQHPEQADAMHRLGVIVARAGHIDLAIELIRRAITLQSNMPEAYNNLGNVLQSKGRFDEAIALYRQATAIKPDFPEAHHNLGTALAKQGHLDESIAAYRQAIALKPDSCEAYGNLGKVLAEKGEVEQAIAADRHAIELMPANAAAHYNLALALLLRGEFQQGWQEFEWRWKCKGVVSGLRELPEPHWDGQPLDGRTILLRAEQGFGDAIQFIRYLPPVKQRAQRVIIECPAALQRLFCGMAPDIETIGQGQPLPAFDFQCPLLSLPRVFQTTLKSIPQNVPYLHANAADVEKWRRQLIQHSPATKVGLSWAGNPSHQRDRYRSIPAQEFAPLGKAPEIRFYSLQKSVANAKQKNLPAGIDLVDWTDDFKDFADTAALIANLDLVISADTAIAHLAGAMGKPVWTLLPFIRDWRWLQNRQDSPWYPTMRLFRQPSVGDWNNVIRRVGEAIPVWAESRRRDLNP